MRRLVIGMAAVAMLVGIGVAAAMLVGPGCSGSGNLSSSDPKEVAKAVQAAASAGDDRAADKIAPLAHHEDAQTASVAIVALSRMPSQRAFETLRQVATADQRPEVRQAAMSALAQRKEPEALETLREALTRDTAPEVRSEAALGLARAGTIDDVPVLANAASREKDPKVARAQELAMGRLTGVKFPPPDPKMTPAQQREQRQRNQRTAVKLANDKKNGIAQGSCKHPSQ